MLYIAAACPPACGGTLSFTYEETRQDRSYITPKESPTSSFCGSTDAAFQEQETMEALMAESLLSVKCLMIPFPGALTYDLLEAIVGPKPSETNAAFFENASGPEGVGCAP